MCCKIECELGSILRFIYFVIIFLLFPYKIRNKAQIAHTAWDGDSINREAKGTLTHRTKIAVKFSVKRDVNNLVWFS